MIDKSKTFDFIQFNNNDIKGFFSERNGETKLGQTISNLSSAKYVIIGVEESFGPRANKGRSGAENAFSAFLSSFLNMQSNESLIGDNIHVLGKIIAKDQNESNLFEVVEELDAFLVNILQSYLKNGQIPIVIGGGHNNAFPLIKYSYEQHKEPIQVVNFDAHADYRLLEGRHSGNPFSYAFNQGFLKKYNVLGLHQRYNSQQIIDDLRRDGHYFTFHESYLFGKHNYIDDFKTLCDTLSHENEYTGIELDMDTIERMPSSAYSPVGISIETARLYIYRMAKINNIAYLHLPEGAPTNEIENRIVGKTLAYLVSDFIIARG
ncbi:MAG TPA: formimidoylglutamase [Brumimicrobium sp.]|nr:formimidoylglutamase [Brumimicrobium sp.]